MRVSDVMSRTLLSVPPDMPLRDVARLLSEHRISGAPVVEDGRCIGVVSEADLLIKQLGRPISRRLPIEWIIGERHDPEELRRRAATTAREAMSSPAIVIEADRPLREAAALMVDRGVNRLPVIDAGRVIGILTRSDLVRAYLRLDDEIRRAVREEILRHTMWLDPDQLQVTVREGIVVLSGTVDRRSTARIIEKLVGLVDGVARVDSTLAWELDDERIEPPGEEEREPGASSVVRRDHPQPLHR
ncbi:MAG TPA: CBS domain-containing protein [Candidatus Limnocylindrales bacterium]|nr:CBS domain-containing protein [Candidatus Limnocylindrales bacterium]